MSLYHVHCGCVGRSQGKTSVGASAYRSCEKLTNENDGITHDYTHKKGLLHKEIIAPDDAPEWVNDRQTLWNEVEKKENRKNSVFAKDMDIALQKELTLEQNLECLKKLIKKNCTDKGLVVDLCIHAPHQNPDGSDNHNIHAHLLITTRKLSADGWHEKVFSKLKDEHEWLDTVREEWATIVNQKFEQLKINEHIDHRTLQEQGIDREPQQHMGPIATAIERSGRTPDRQRYATEVTQTENVTEVTEKDLQKSLNMNETYRQLVALLNYQLEQEKKAEKILKYKNEKKIRQTYSFYNDILILNYVQNNAEQERKFYLGFRNNPSAAQQLNRIDTILSIKNVRESHPNVTLHEYGMTTQKEFPSHWQEIKQWISEKASPFFQGIQNMAHKIGNYLAIRNQEQKVLVSDHNEEHKKKPLFRRK